MEKMRLSKPPILNIWKFIEALGLASGGQNFFPNTSPHPQEGISQDLLLCLQDAKKNIHPDCLLNQEGVFYKLTSLAPFAYLVFTPFQNGERRHFYP